MNVNWDLKDEEQQILPTTDGNMTGSMLFIIS